MGSWPGVYLMGSSVVVAAAGAAAMLLVVLLLAQQPRRELHKLSGGNLSTHLHLVDDDLLMTL